MNNVSNWKEGIKCGLRRECISTIVVAEQYNEE